MTKVVALFAVAGMTAVVAAQPGNRTGVDVMVRLAGAPDWEASVTAGPGDVVEVATFYWRSVGYGFARAVHNIRAFGWTAGDAASIVDNPASSLHPDGRVGPGGALGGFNFGGNRQDIYLAGVNAPMRISTFGNPNDIAAGGISVRQNTPVALSANFNTADGIMGYRFNITVGDGLGGRVIDIAAGNFDVFATYDSAGSTSSTPFTGAREDRAAAIQVTPTPASLALLGLGGLVAGRRRRSSDDLGWNS